MDEVKVTYGNKAYSFPGGISLLEVSKNFSENYKYDILAGKVNSDIMPLDYVINEDCSLDFFDLSSFVGNKIYERSTILILAKAVKDVMKAEVRVEHSIDRGIYCIIDNLSKEKVSLILNRMREIVSTNYPIEKLNMNRLKMINYYQQMKQYDKAELLKYISNTFITIYRLDDIYDYMYGEMAINTSYIKYFNLEYLDGDGCVLMLPFTYDDNKVSYYVHHKKLFNSIMDYLNWSHKIGISNFPDINRLLTEGKWTDLVLMCESNQNKKLMDIAHDIATNKRKIVLISGPSCSGKTTTSKKLKLFLEGEGVKAYMLSVDDYFKERDETPLDENGHKDYESIRAVDTKLFNKQMTQLLDGEEVLLPTYNFVTGKKEYSNKLKMNKTDILIIEGLHSLNDSLTDEISSDKKYRIYISPLTCLNLDNHNRLNTTDNRLLRRIVRDYQTRGYNASQTLECWDRVRRGETKYIFPYQDSADVVLNTSLSYEISALKVYAEPLLFSVKDDDPNYKEAIRLINMLRMILPMPSEGIPLDSIMREFIGNGCFDE